MRQERRQARGKQTAPRTSFQLGLDLLGLLLLEALLEHGW
jgi:hypothetical protein